MTRPVILTDNSPNRGYHADSLIPDPPNQTFAWRIPGTSCLEISHGGLGRTDILNPKPLQKPTTRKRPGWMHSAHAKSGLLRVALRAFWLVAGC